MHQKTFPKHSFQVIPLASSGNFTNSVSEHSDFLRLSEIFSFFSQEMAQKLSTRLRNLEEGMAELQDDKGAARDWPRQPTRAWPQAFPRALRGSARVVQKAEKFDAAEQSAAQVHGLERRHIGP